MYEEDETCSTTNLCIPCTHARRCTLHTSHARTHTRTHARMHACMQTHIDSRIDCVEVHPHEKERGAPSPIALLYRMSPPACLSREGYSCWYSKRPLVYAHVGTRARAHVCTHICTHVCAHVNTHAYKGAHRRQDQMCGGASRPQLNRAVETPPA